MDHRTHLRAVHTGNPAHQRLRLQREQEHVELHRPGYQAAVERVWGITDPSSTDAEDAYRALNTELLDNAFVIGLFNHENELAASAALQGVGWTRRASST